MLQRAPFSLAIDALTKNMHKSCCKMPNKPQRICHRRTTLIYNEWYIVYFRSKLLEEPDEKEFLLYNYG